MKNSHLLHKALSFLTNTIIIVTLSLAFYITIPLDVHQKTITLPKGSVTNIIRSLQQQGYKLSTIDTYLLVAIGQPKSGTLDIGKGKINRIDFLNRLTSASEAIEIITLIPGETRPIFLSDIAKKHQLDFQKLDGNYSHYSHYQEAGILPDTYHLPKGIKEENLIKFLVKQSEIKYKKLSIQKLGYYTPKSWLPYLIVASIIQKEAANREEMPIIASVIYNRLKLGMPLQMDGTLNYGKYSHIKVTPERIKKDTSGFNTYLNTGLPPYPICSVSLDAINAAISPIKSDYLYFMKNRSGTHDFSRTYKEHLRNISRAKKAQ
jgi:UPF0755 protein